MAFPKLEVRNVSKSFRRPDGELMPVVDALSLSVTPLEFMALLGPSGCGKSTLLRMIDGLLPCDTGSIYLDGDDITGVPGNGRGMVFQTFDLFPWRTALGNVEFGLEVQGIQKPERRERARRYLGLVGLQGFEDSYPHQLSGRNATTGGNRPRLCHPARGAPDGRAVRGSGRADAGHPAGRTPPHLGARPEDRPLRHPRHRGGDLPRGPDRRLQPAAGEDRPRDSRALRPTTARGDEDERQGPGASVCRAPYIHGHIPMPARERGSTVCPDLTHAGLSFSSSVAWADVKDAVLKGPGGRQWKAKLESRGYDEEAYVNSVAFEGPFPERSTFTLEIPAGLKDDAGRPLTNASSFPITVRTDEYPPLAKFAAEFGILELKGGALLPVTLRNVEPSVPARVLDVVEGQVNLDPVVETPEQRAVNTAMRGPILKVPSAYPGQMFAWIRKVSRRNWEDRDKSIFGPATKPRARAISIPKPAGAKAFEVMGIPLKSPGFYVVEIESEILGAHLLSPFSKLITLEVLSLITQPPAEPEV